MGNNNQISILKSELGLKLNEGKVAVVSSRVIAKNFKKRPSEINRKIEDLINDLEGVQNCTTLFIETKYQHLQNKQWYKEYLLTKDGFSLLVMGLTGKEALEWKLKYINAFNKMEEYIKNQNSLIQGNQTMFLAQNIQQIASTMAQFMENSAIQLQQIKEQTKGEVKEIVRDSIIIKDQQIEETAQLIGLRAKNTKMLVNALKEKLKNLTGCKVTAKDYIYEKAKNKLFKKFGVVTWEDISIGKFNTVYSFIDALEKEDIKIY
ncbi:Rha family transcriptional regulator [Clostridium botulinum C]|uniref:Phage regulatory protein n=2 Tax=Clostridium botulinum TaxID=1491 RepID=A0A6G4D9N9_CLOBO|nr:Rha family transcriptional regulator [Clostridium botulinum]MCD3196039.1 Rha family transcriptional regulator [Clostridium botulinum C]MCD3200330.1 Rha family transcriptional regulator [Clostridium botulinum C]MCD3206863.1 Rha family transcriptional regulator [Clostridium botulinum C]MCD3207562.1 Rha family transcriptional regulator [Clostridium botulinum C]MCD3226296.1 Rha family transcriptional regulator [Clostridium botulinum C]